MISQLNPSDFAAWRQRVTADAAPASVPVVLDVREAWEVQTACVKEDGFRLLTVPMREIPARLEELRETLGADHPIACLCHHGMRSLRVAAFLEHHGFARVANITGGIDAWACARHPGVPRY